MNFKTTIALLVLVAAGAGLTVPLLLDRTAVKPITKEGTAAALDNLKPDDLTRIEISKGDRTTTLTREKGVWSMPGKWPTRGPEVKALAELLGGLRSRFEPIRITEETDLSPFGLKDAPLTVRLETDKAKYQFLLGEEPATGDSNQFSRPTYLRLVSGPGVSEPAAEVVRLGPGLLALLDRSTDYYQDRRLFPSERAVKEDNSNQKVDRLVARSVQVAETKEGGVKYTLVRKDKTWELKEPSRDRLDPRPQEALLVALADLWAERFQPTDAPTVVGAFSGEPLTAAGWVLMTTPTHAPKWMPVKTGLEKPERTIVVERENGEKVTLLIGGIARSTMKRVVRQPPPGAPFPPRVEMVAEEYRYAKLQDNDQLFEIKGEPLKDVFVTADTLREARLARFTANEVKDIEIAQPGQETIALTKENDRWKLIKPLKAEADNDKVSELLTKLSGLEARGDDVIVKEEEAHGFDKDKPGTSITVKWESEKKETDGTTSKTAQETTLKLGKHDTEKKKLYLKVDDWPRVNAVDDSLVSLASRPALAYRGKRLLDFAAREVATIDVQRGAETLTFKQDKEGWNLVAPVEAKVDSAKVNLIADALGKLEVLEFVDDEPKEEQLDPMYGVGKTAGVVVTVTFTDKTKPARTLRLGKARGMKPGFFGKMADGMPVFALDEGIQKQLDRDSLAYLPSELWQLLPEEIVSVRIKKEGQDEFTLKRMGDKWQIAGPFDAPALAAAVQAMMTDLATARVESHKAHETKELAMYGLDKPALTIAVKSRDDKEYTLLIGKPIEPDSSSRYAKLADKPGVFVVSEQLVSAADRPALELLDPILLRLDPGKVERINTKTGDTTLTLERKGEEWQVLDTPGSPFPADNQAMGAMQFLWANLRATRFADYGPKVDWAKYGLDKPALVVTVKEGAKDHTIELGKHVEGDSGPRYARFDKGQGVAVLNGIVSQTLARSYLDYVNRSVLQFKPDDVASVQRQMGAEVLVLTRKDDGWQIVKPAEQRADDKSLQELIGQLADLKAVRVAAFPAKELKTYGLDDPVAVVTITLKADAKPVEHIVKLGKPVEADGSERYAVVGDSKAVVVLSASLSKRLAAAPITYRDRSIARFADADKLRLERGPRQAVFARVEGSWKLTEPAMADADNDELDEFLNTLAKLRADELVAEKPTAEELKTYGLDKPEAQWKLFAGDKEVLNLVVGGREKVGIRRYAQLAGKDVVFLLDPKLSVRALGEFRTRTVWAQPLDAFQVESVSYGYAKNPFVLLKTPTGWQVEGKPDAKPNTATVNETLAALAGLKLSRYVVDKGADFKLFGLEPPELSLEITTPTGKRTLHLGRPEGDSKRLYARIPDANRSDVFVIEEADAAKILRDLAAFTKAP